MHKTLSEHLFTHEHTTNYMMNAPLPADLEIKLSTLFASHFLLLHRDWLANVGNDLGNGRNEGITVDMQLAVPGEHAADDRVCHRVGQQQFTQHLNHMLPTTPTAHHQHHRNFSTRPGM